VTTTEETTDETTDAPKEPTIKRCFSGSGRYANRKWAPGGDATYLSRLRKAHLAGETLPDPWVVQEHGGVEAENVPADGWPQTTPMDIAQRLDQERGGGVDSHWVHTLEQASEKAKVKEEAKANRAASTRKTKEERDAERQRQQARPKKNSKVTRAGGEYDGQEATVLRAISPTQLLIRYDGGMEELVTDEDVQAIAPVEGEEPQAEAQPEGEFVEQ
jgi:hypothetical protein